MSRADYLVAVGDTEYPPAEWMWDELEAEVDQIKRVEGIAHLPLREALSTFAAKQAITAWKQRRKLSPATS